MGWQRVCGVVAAVLLAGCTTVTRTAVVGSGAGGPGLAGAGPNAASGSGGLPQSASGGVGGTSALTGATGSGGGATGGFAGANAVSGPNAPAGTACRQLVKIGVSYSSDEAQALAVVGNPTEAQQDANYAAQQQAQSAAIASYVNAHGGLAGCRVELVYHDFKSLGSDGFSGESETECVDFAQDQHVFAVIPTTLENKTLITCLAQNHVVDLYGGNVYDPTPADFAQYRGYLYQPDLMTPYRFGSFVAQLGSAGYFGTKAKVGILLADDGSGTNEYLVDKLWKPALAAMGITPVVFTYSAIESYHDVASVSQAFGSAVLQFKSAGVDHVMMTPDGGNATVFFTQVAESQNFHPRYALNSYDAAVAWNTEPSGQLSGAMDVSFNVVDLANNPPTDRQIDTNPPSATRTVCKSLTKANPALYSMCDNFLFLQQALAGASDVTPASLLAGADRLGASFPLAAGYGTARLGGPDHYDGGPATRVLAWSDSSQEWQYATPPEPVPWA